MNIDDLKGKMVAVLGFGVEGKAATGYLLKHGVKPVLFDEKKWEEWGINEREYIKKLGVNFIFGPKAFLELKGFDVAFRSPGISLRKLKVKSEKCKVTSQTKFFFDNCKAKIIGVTGTKGKGTTASLIFKIFIKQFQISPPKADPSWEENPQFQNVHLTGNIGKTQSLEILDDLKKDDWVVYELSSFQLQDLKKSPHIGVILMTTSEHLDYHKDNEEYVEAKTSIVKYQSSNDYAVINADFPSSVKIGGMGKGRKIYFSRRKELGSGVFVKDGQIIVKNVLGKNIQYPMSDIQLRGGHNLENICAGIAAALCAGCETDAIKSAIKNFKGLEHRLEFVAEKNGVKYYNDSFSTTPETAIAAIKSFNEPLIVILGGSGKNSDFTELGKIIRETKNIKALILIGDEAVRIKRKIGQVNVIIKEGAGSMPEIFDQINHIKASGDVVLFSPACASFGMFKNYKDRGEQFKKLAQS